MRRWMCSYGSFIVALLAGAWLAGCSYSMVENGELRRDVFEDLARRTALTRGGSYPDDLRTSVVSRDAVPGLVREMVLNEWSTAELADYQASLEVIGVWPHGRDYLEEFECLAKQQIAGWYSVEDRRLYVVEEVSGVPTSLRLTSALLRRDLYREFVLSHELVHAIQDNEYRELMSTMAGLRQHDDFGLAASAAIEGDALVYGMLTLGGPSALLDVDTYEEQMRVSSLAELERSNPDAPVLVREALLFPYQYGYRLAVRERAALLQDPPVSTEQAMHPPDRDQPFTLISLESVADEVAKTCRVVWRNTLGEFGISVLFSRHDETIAADAWRGWDGDRYLVAECDGRREFLWVSLWDTEKDAIEFVSAYESVHAALESESGGAGPRRVRREGREVAISSAGLERWGTPPVAGQRTIIANFDDFVALLAVTAADRKRANSGR